MAIGNNCTITLLKREDLNSVLLKAKKKEHFHKQHLAKRGLNCYRNQKR